MSDLYMEMLNCLMVKQLHSKLIHYGMPETSQKEELKQRLLEKFESHQTDVDKSTSEKSKVDVNSKGHTTPITTLVLKGIKPMQQQNDFNSRDHRKAAKAKCKAEIRKMLSEMDSSSDEDSSGHKEENYHLQEACVYGSHMMLKK